MHSFNDLFSTLPTTWLHRSNLLTVAGDYFIFGKTYGLAVWACIMLMIASAAAGGMTDAKFS